MGSLKTQKNDSITAQVPVKRRRFQWLMGLIIVTLAWLGFDFYGPSSSSLRGFDPTEVARLETAMWRSYYAKEHAHLFLQLAELMRKQYHMPFARSNVVAYQAARAAFVFKEGKNRVDYERALPPLIRFYTAIRNVSDTAFDINRAARLELEWWIAHRERARLGRTELERALAEWSAEIYRRPKDQFREHARLRADAMIIRDERAEIGDLGETDWARIQELLCASWVSLWQAVNS